MTARPLVGLAVQEALPEVAGQGFVQLLHQVMATGAPVEGREARVRLQRQPGAIRAGRRRGTAQAAVMALQAAAVRVYGHRAVLFRGRAARAAGAPAAVVAQQHRCVAAAVAEHQDLAAGRQVLFDPAQHLL